MKIFMCVFCVFIMVSDSKPDWLETARKSAEKELEALVGDIGAAVSGGLYQQAGVMGFPGASVHIGIGAVPVSEDNPIIKKSLIPIPRITAELGLPGGADIFIRGFKYEVAGTDSAIDMLGAGLKYGILSDKPLLPVPGVSAIIAYNSFQASGLKVETTTAGILVSKNLPLIAPHVGVFYDLTSSKIKTEAGTLKPSANHLRFGGGLKLSPLPFFFINASGDFYQGNFGWNIGTGIEVTLPF